MGPKIPYYGHSKCASLLGAGEVNDGLLEGTCKHAGAQESQRDTEVVERQVSPRIQVCMWELPKLTGPKFNTDPIS